eukprot:m.115018 g.115018  ORF g.115018 m.115018 type:complete len:89 (+) comp14438_c1_seq1:202-468(+)
MEDTSAASVDPAGASPTSKSEGNNLHIMFSCFVCSVVSSLARASLAGEWTDNAHPPQSQTRTITSSGLVYRSQSTLFTCNSVLSFESS